jgi:hypothetical protein
VIRESADPEQRTIAAYLLQYGPRGPRTSRIITDALQYALQDQQDSVRQNAMRSLEAIAIGAKLNPDQQIRVEPTWFIELLNSVVWSDRRNASLALVDLTDNRDPDTLALLRQRSLDSVLEMARWHNLEHALPAFILAGRLAGLTEKQIQDAWVSGNREPVLEKALHPNKKIKLAYTPSSASSGSPSETVCSSTASSSTGSGSTCLSRIIGVSHTQQSLQR